MAFSRPVIDQIEVETAVEGVCESGHDIASVVGFANRHHLIVALIAEILLPLHVPEGIDLDQPGILIAKMGCPG